MSRTRSPHCRIEPHRDRRQPKWGGVVEIAIEWHARESWLATTVRVLALFALVLVAGVIVADTAGQNLAVSDPDGALLVAPWEPIALDELAQRQLTSTSGELSSVEDLARRALAVRSSRFARAFVAWIRR